MEWDTMKELATFAQKWKPNGAYQSTADLYFGTGSEKYHERIINNFKNVVSFHDSPSFWSGPKNDQEAALFEIWCDENGPDGKVPRPDSRSDELEWYADVCHRGNYYGYSFRRHRWWWIHPDVYYTVLCPRTWTDKNNMTYMKELIDEKGKYNLDLDFLFLLRASSYLHEILPHEIVSDPKIQDVMIRWWFGKGAAVYSPKMAAYFAKWIGPLRKVADDEGGYGGEFGTIINAENYAAFAVSVYFQETLSHAEPFEPKDPSWKNWDQEEADPFLGQRPYLAEGIQANFGILDNSEETSEDTSSMVPVKNRALCVDGYRPDPDQQPFTQADGAAAIERFCSKNANRSLMLTPLISIGSGRTPREQDRIAAYDNAPNDKAPEKGIWLNIRFADDGSIGRFLIGQGKSAEDNVQDCVDKFGLSLNSCQTNTITEKYGGALQVGSAYYQMAGRFTNMTNIFQLGPTGPLSCVPTNATILPTLARSCTCKYQYYKATDVFRLPSSGNCNDVDPTKDLCDDLPAYVCRGDDQKQ